MTHIKCSTVNAIHSTHISCLIGLSLSKEKSRTFLASIVTNDDTCMDRSQFQRNVWEKFTIQKNLSSRDTATRGQPVIRGNFLRTVSYLPHVKEPVTKGHLSCRDTFSQILRCPLKTGFTVVSYFIQFHD